MIYTREDTYCSWQTAPTDGVRTNASGARSGMTYHQRHCCNTITNSNCLLSLLITNFCFQVSKIYVIYALSTEKFSNMGNNVILKIT